MGTFSLCAFIVEIIGVTIIGHFRVQGHSYGPLLKKSGKSYAVSTELGPNQTRTHILALYAKTH